MEEEGEKKKKGGVGAEADGWAIFSSAAAAAALLYIPLRLCRSAERLCQKIHASLGGSPGFSQEEEGGDLHRKYPDRRAGGRRMVRWGG